MNLSSKELIRQVAAETQLPQRTVKMVVVSMLDVMRDHLTCGDPVVLPGIGTIRHHYRAGRTAKTLPNQPAFKQPETYYLKLKNSKSLQEALRALCKELGGVSGLPEAQKPSKRRLDASNGPS